MPLTKKMQIQVATEVGLSVAKHYYEMFKDGDNRGPNFKWEHLPDMCRRGATVHVGVSLPHNIKAQDEIEQIAGDTAYNEAKRLMEDNNA